MNKPEEAVECFKQTFSCSQAVFSAYASEFGIDMETALKIAGAFGGGMARMGETCGAVTAAFMVIGLKYGKTRAEDEPAKEKTYQVVREFVEKFKLRNSSIVCRELTGCDMNSPEGLQAFKEKNLLKTHCTKFVKDAAEIVEELIR
ncbi:MAG: C-GCAxxG-C-C family protein [Proteobacteria bacterium]|nr:C-GCAxxG-C-C family protein [Pseudomonadota bacterium]